MLSSFLRRPFSLMIFYIFYYAVYHYIFVTHVTVIVDYCIRIHRRAPFSLLASALLSEIRYYYHTSYLFYFIYDFGKVHQ